MALVLLGISFLGLILLFRLYYFHLNRKYGSRVVCIMYISILCFAFCIYVVSNMGSLFSDVLGVFMGSWVGWNSVLPPLPADSVPSASGVEVEQPAPIQPVDDTGEPYNKPNGYWYTRRIIEDYFKSDMDMNFDRTPSYSKYRRVFELVVGPNFKSQARLLEVLSDIADNPANNHTIERARRIMNSIYQQQIKDRHLDSYQFEEDG